MKNLLSEGTERRGVDRRKGGDRRSLRRGIERRLSERRLGPAAAGLIVAACLAAPHPAQAQIRTWHDAKGTLVLSNRGLDSDAKPPEVVKARLQTTTTVAPLARRGFEYDGIIDEQCAVHGIRPALVRAVIQAESNFNPRAYSPKGAMGLMQLMPGTAADLGVLNPFNGLENIRGGVAYLRQLLNRYNNDETLALAAYNAGPAAVDRHGSQVPPYRETQQYVKRILGSTPSADIVEASTKIIYKTTEVIDGSIVSRYSTSKPAAGPYEIMKLG